MAAASDYGFLSQTPRMFPLPSKRGHRLAITLDDLRWRDPDGRELILQRGFPTDGLSLPGVARLLGYDCWGAGLRGGLLHDAGYSLYPFDALFFGNRRQVDARFRLGCEIDYPEMAGLYYWAVRAFGRSSWSKPNQPLVEDYVAACRADVLDTWIEGIITRYGGPVIDLSPAN